MSLSAPLSSVRRAFTATAMGLLFAVVGCTSGELDENSTSDAFDCPAGQLACAGGCVNAASDGQNCGACGNTCIGASSCSAGACVSSCPAGSVACGASCSDTLNDPLNCGACGTICGVGASCVAGACTCQDGLSDCGGTCVNTISNGDNCGDCGTTCGAQFCTSGTCADSCASGQTACGNSCVDVATDTFNCGTCGTTCSAGQICEGSECTCPDGLTDCAGQCVDVEGSGTNCGACGITCTGDQTCVAGVCSGGTGGTGGAGTGGAGTGGAGTGGTGTGGAETGGTCTNVRPTGTDWDAGTCEGWATETDECDAAWMVSNNLCNESCGRCTPSGTGGAGTGGAGTGGAGAGTGGAGSGGTASTCSEPDEQVCGNEIGSHCGYTTEYWKDQGTGCQTNTADGFDVEWNNINNLLGRKGLRPGSKSQVVTYDADYQPNGNSYLCVYGWARNPLVEYYIVDSWGSWRPPGSGSMGATVSTDGGTYDIYRTQRVNQPSIDGNTTFYQYWSVRTTKRESGTITVANHFAAWEALGMTMGNLYEVSMCVEGYQSSGTASVSMSMK